MVTQSVSNDLVDFLLKLDKAFDKHDYPLGARMNIYALICFHQFNGTRNDLETAFRKIVKEMNIKKENEEKGE